MNAAQIGIRLARDRHLVNRALARALRAGPGVPGRLAQAMRYAVLGPGKRLRPILCLEAFRAGRGSPDRAVLPFCCGIEFIHAFSLVHDDLPSMDDDDFRRGRPSLHRRFDEATAILAADALFARAFELFCQTRTEAELVVAATRLVCRAVGPAGMTGGQLLDIAAPRRHEKTGRRMALVNQKKTAEFIAASLESGALLAGANEKVCRGLRQYGLALGELFQVTDDLIDIGRDTTLSHKERGQAKEVRSEARGAGSAAVPGLRGSELERQAEMLAARAGEQLSWPGAQNSVLAALPSLILHRSA
jgi:geranylgeranyl diphosphate synthase type II